jgi:hypothetical protein
MKTYQVISHFGTIHIKADKVVEVDTNTSRELNFYRGEELVASFNGWNGWLELLAAEVPCQAICK